MGPFRDMDQGEATRFSQHIAVAEDVLDMIEEIPRRVEAGHVLTQETLDQLSRDVHVGWENVWDHLQQARAIVAAKGRDVRTFDEARASAGDIWNDIASGKSVGVGREIHVSWRSVPTGSARSAVAALRAAMPEVVVTKQAPLDVDLSSLGGKLVNNALGIASALIGVGVLAYIIYRVAT